jgi:hypothetical protein
MLTRIGSTAKWSDRADFAYSTLLIGVGILIVALLI